ncbi:MULTISPECIES: DUF416 family protein [Rhodanobacteraceae]|uniref:DUF416 family protein n=1 Tax=Rhodanobacteraceae TaxID=1775411 RepID=UPI0009A901D7|nr:MULTISPECIES: DUF416 family protein [Rhodanobacteraceae]
MPNRFDKLNDLRLLEDLPLCSRVAVAAAALERMSTGYAIWSPEVEHTPVGRILDDVWAYVAAGKDLPDAATMEGFYPSQEAAVTLESPYAESFIEALQLLALFASTQDVMRLVEVRQAAYNMADNAAGDVLVRYNDPQFNYRLTSETEQLMSNHPWVDRELEAQDADVLAAKRTPDFDRLVDQLRARARAHPVVSMSDFDKIRAFQAG